jgi:glutaredoxin
LHSLKERGRRWALTLFTKDGCEKCEYVKKSVDLKRLGVRLEILSPDNAESLAHLAWHELVSVAETQLPILVLDDNSTLTGAIRIKNHLTAMRDQRSAVGMPE